MSEQQTKKKKNKKKKSPVVQNPDATPSTDQTCQNGTKEMFNINSVVLPQKVGMKTIFKDVEVTMTSCGNTSEVTNGTAKKKKKKKKSKQQSTENPAEPATAEAESEAKLLSFDKDHIELVNHPEISVTLSSVPVSQVKTSSTPKSEVLEHKEDTKTDSATAKKKKKKKKKKKVANSDVVKPEPSNPEEASSNTPTYVKLPADGDNCVLLVSHESFSTAANSSVNNTDKSSPSGSATILIKSKEKMELDQAKFKPEIPSGSSVSILPVSNPGAVTEKTPEMSIASGLEKVNNLIKSEVVEDKTPEEASEGEVKSKAQLKAERRAKQEAQRAAKASKIPEKEPAKDPQIKTETQQQAKKEQSAAKALLVEPSSKITSKTSTDRDTFRKAQVFSHLPQFKDFSEANSSHLKIHPAILELGSQYSKGVLCGSNARCIGFLAAFREVIRDHKSSTSKSLSRDLEAKLQVYLGFLNSCRPLSVSVLNAVKVLKQQMNHLSEDTKEEQAKKILCESIESFAEFDVLLAMKAICLSATAKIVDGDTVLVFAYSSLVKDVLCTAHDQGKAFSVVVVDSRPNFEGREMLRRLVAHGLKCSYILIGAASYVMKKVSKVIIGAHALLSNGCVMSRLGCKQLALVALAFSVPVLVCCETYKFWERALTDSFVHNELGNPEDIVSVSRNDSLKNWRELPLLQIYHILYDVTPSDLISVVITEKGLLPCTSVPVVLRVKHAGSKNSGTN